MPSAIAGVKDITIHSRANCGNNESITWDATRSHMLYTKSDHYKNGQFHHASATGWADTRRSAAVCWWEGNSGGWYVEGFHWRTIGGWLHKVGYGITTASGCNIYDGWWEM